MSAKEVGVRLATFDDAAAIREVYAPYVAGTAISFELDVPSVDDVRSRIGDGLPAYPWLVAEVDGKVRGYAYGARYMARAAYAWTVATSVYCAPAARGRGVGSRLYDALFHTLTRQGFVLAVAGITRPNPASEAIHARFGFTPVGVFPRVGFKAGAWHDVLWLSRPLADPLPAFPAQPRPAPAVVANAEWQARFGPPHRA